MEAFNAYQYEPLGTEDEIRLLVLNPAKNRITPLRCSIVPYRRASQTRKYSAVSYAWGKAKPTHSLEISQNNDTSYLKITATVDVMLRYLRAPREVRYLWIDAICLNQDDEIEKACQVLVMGRIYKEATDVRIWLGVGNVVTSTLYDFFWKVSRGPELEQRMMADHIVALMKRVFHRGTQPALGDHWNPGCHVAVGCYFQFFQNPWFSRRWIIQEAVLARKAMVQSGNYEIPLDIVTLAAKRLQSFDTSDYPMKMAATMGKRTKSLSLMENLWIFHGACCSEKKDRIASLIGLSSGDGFELDYRMPWEDIYKQVASYALCSRRNDNKIQVLLHLFEFGPVTDTNALNYPSWVPDWSKTRTRKLPYHSNIRNMDTHEKYPAVLAVSDKAALILNDNILHIQPHRSEGRHQLWKVVGTGFSGTSRVESGQVIQLLEGFFPPSSADSPRMILEFSSFIQYIGEFCQIRDADQNAAFEIYTRQLLRKIPGSITSEYFEALRWLGTLLQDFYFCNLRPYGLADLTNCPARAVGFSPRRIFPGDSLVPVWRRIEDGSKSRLIWNSGARITIEITTMLVVRYDEELHRGPDCRPVEEDVEKRRGRIIGPALGLEFWRTEGFEVTPITKSERSGFEEGFFVV